MPQFSPLASSIPAPGIEYADETFHVTSTILSALAISIFVLGFSVRIYIQKPVPAISLTLEEKYSQKQNRLAPLYSLR